MGGFFWVGFVCLFVIFTDSFSCRCLFIFPGSIYDYCNFNFVLINNIFLTIIIASASFSPKVYFVVCCMFHSHAFLKWQMLYCSCLVTTRDFVLLEVFLPAYRSVNSTRIGNLQFLALFSPPLKEGNAPFFFLFFTYLFF